MFLVFLLITLIIILVIINQYKKYEKLFPYHANIEQRTLNNTNYRNVEYTVNDSMQLVLMNLKSGEEIGSEVHPSTTQFIRIEKGNGIAEIDDIKYQLSDNMTVIIPPGHKHNIINTGSDNMKLYTIYTPPEHDPNLIQVNKN